MIEKLKYYALEFKKEWKRVKQNPKPDIFQATYFWAVFSKKEKVIFGLFFCAMIVFGGVFINLFFKYHIAYVPDVGGSYIEGTTEEPRFINPILAANEMEQAISNLIFQSLFRYNEKGVLEPEAAESLLVSSDGKTYTIVLKKGNVWHDEKPVIADDVLFTIAMIQNPEFKSSLRPNWQGVTAEKVDDHRIILRLRQPYAAFVQNLTLGILPQHLWAGVRPEHSFQTELNTKPVGSGQYRFQKLTRLTNGSILSYTIERADIPSNQPPYLKKITFQVFGSEETMLAAYQHGKINGMDFISAENIQKISRTKGAIYAVSLPQVFALFFNQSENKILGDKKIREALESAINKSELVSTVLKNSGSVVNSPLPPMSLGFDGLIQASDFNVDHANTILDQAGWKINSGTGFREKTVPKTKEFPNGVQELKITITTSVWPDLVEVGQYIKESWKKIGINVTLQTVPITELEHQYIRPRKYEVLLFGESFGHDSDPFAFWHSSQIKHPGLNIALYSNKKVDLLLESARRTVNQDDIAQKYKESQQLIIADRPAIFLYAPKYFFTMDNEIKGVTPENIIRPSERFLQEHTWYIDTDWKLK